VSTSCSIAVLLLGEKLTEDEVSELLQGHEDNQGNVNYEGLSTFDFVFKWVIFSRHKSWEFPFKRGLVQSLHA